MEKEKLNHTTSKSRICENCEFIIYSGEYNEIPKCLLSGEKIGLFYACDDFKFTTGKHYTS